MRDLYDFSEKHNINRLIKIYHIILNHIKLIEIR